MRSCKTMLWVLCGVLLVLSAPCPSLPAADEAPPTWTVELEFSPDIHKEPYTGRVYVFFSKEEDQPRHGPNWFRPEPFVSRDVADWKPGDVLTFSNADLKDTLAYPREFARLDLSGYRVQAVARFNPYEREVGTGPGNGFSEAKDIPGDLDATAKPPRVLINQIVPEFQYPETRWAKEFQLRSKLLSDFHGRDVKMHAAVVLPDSYYDEPRRRYPVIYQIPGFSGTHYLGKVEEPIAEDNQEGVEFLRVFLDPSCPLGHHVFADSANNGPVGEALIKELIPALEKEYRIINEPTARFLTGHSSGGWSSLWLQVTYPENFGGTWSTAPDPVDFRDFQQINLYEPGENMYHDAQGKLRPIARSGGDVKLWYRDFDHMETVLGYGGQLHSFEAVFSHKGKDGKPLLAWNRETGEVHTQVTKTWEKYDIRLVLERNWKTLGPKLEGKLHIFMGDEDTFYLEGATILLKESLDQLPGEKVVEIHKGKNHGSLMTPELCSRMRAEMVEAFLKHHEP